MLTKAYRLRLVVSLGGRAVGVLGVAVGVSRAPPPTSALFPYTTLFRSVPMPGGVPADNDRANRASWAAWAGRARAVDRKSTRLNSSHLGISYAVFCLKKKTEYMRSVAHPPTYPDDSETLDRLKYFRARA